MVALAHDLDSDELAVANELIRSAIRLCADRDPARMALIAAHAAGQIAGVTQAYHSRRPHSELVAIHALRAFEEATTRCYLHVMPEQFTDPVARLLVDTQRPETRGLRERLAGL